VIWAVALPLLQAAVLAIVFSRVIIRVGDQTHFGVYVMSGVVAWSYFATTVGAGSTAIVDGSGLTDKVWFPRVLLPLVPALGNLVGYGVSVLALIVAVPVLGAPITARLVLLIPATVLLFALAVSLSMVLSALHVYFRDVRFLVQAVLVVWFYVTPIVYPISLLGGLHRVVQLNPMTGIITLFHLATVGKDASWPVPVAASIVSIVVLSVVAVEVNRRRDRLFVDLL
jgi:ABC-type polysaccharide/polyol phosphate export permease